MIGSLVIGGSFALINSTTGLSNSDMALIIIGVACGIVYLWSQK